DVVSVEETASEIKPQELPKVYVPSCPINVKVFINPSDSPDTKAKLDITWEQPDEGPVVNFYIEIKPVDSEQWVDVSADFTLTEPHFTMPTNNLKEFVSYQFRVIAENEAGKSLPSLPSEPIEL
ncbi:unnamed protein product, partial [Heterobilharzia americana]